MDPVRLNCPDQLRVRISFPASQEQPHVPCTPASIDQTRGWQGSERARLGPKSHTRCLHATTPKLNSAPRVRNARTPQFEAAWRQAARKPNSRIRGPKPLPRRVRRSLGARLLLPRADRTQQRRSRAPAEQGPEHPFSSFFFFYHFKPFTLACILPTTKCLTIVHVC
jgi:hypothetical protein